MREMLCMKAIQSSNYWGVAHYITIEYNDKYILRYNKRLFEYYYSTECRAPAYNKFQILLETTNRNDILKTIMTTIPQMSDLKIRLIHCPFTNQYDWFSGKHINIYEGYGYCTEGVEKFLY